MNKTRKSAERIVIPLFAPYSRMVIVVTFKSEGEIPDALDRDALRPAQLPPPVGGDRPAIQTLVDKLPNSRLTGEQMAGIAQSLYGFKDAMVTVEDKPQYGPQRRISIRKPDERNKVKPNYNLADPEFAVILHHLQNLVGVLTIKHFDDPFARESREKVLLIELRKAEMWKPGMSTPSYGLHLDNDGLKLLTYPEPVATKESAGATMDLDAILA